MTQYYKVGSTFVSKQKVDDALNLVKRVISDGCELVSLNDDEVIQHGNKLDAIIAYRRKHDCGIVEAKQAIEYLREEV
jgi:hypothetical protein